MALSDHDMVPVARCPNCGYVHGDDLDYRFPQPSICSCGAETTETTVAEPETVRSLADSQANSEGTDGR